jgi:hypothetical protein
LNNVFIIVFVAVQVVAGLAFLRVAYYSGVFRKVAKDARSPSTGLITGIMLLSLMGVIEGVFWAIVSLAYTAMPRESFELTTNISIIVTVNAGIKLIPAIIMNGLWGDLFE